jgi:hypothetical protein
MTKKEHAILKSFEVLLVSPERCQRILAAFIMMCREERTRYIGVHDSYVFLHRLLEINELFSELEERDLCRKSVTSKGSSLKPASRSSKRPTK